MSREVIKARLVATLIDQYGAGSGLYCAGKKEEDVVHNEWLQVDMQGESHLDLEHLTSEVEAMVDEALAELKNEYEELNFRMERLEK